MSSYSTLKVSELRLKCLDAGLDGKGTKAELIARLEGGAAEDQEVKKRTQT